MSNIAQILLFIFVQKIEYKKILEKMSHFGIKKGYISEGIYMRNRDYDAKDLILTIVKEEKERQEAIKKLNQELRELEKEGDMCDTERIREIIDELEIIDPLPEGGEENETKKAPARKRRYMPLKIAAACVLVIFSIQAVSVTTFSSGSFFERITSWGKGMVSYIVGTEIKETHYDVIGTNTHTYTSIGEFRKQESLDVFIPESIDNSAIVEISYLFEGKKSITIYYENEYVLIIKLDNAVGVAFDEDNRISYTYDNIEYLIDLDYGAISWLLDDSMYILTGNYNADSYEEIILSMK